MIGALLVVAQLAVTVSAPDTLSVGEPGTVTVEASAPGTVPPRVVAPSFYPLAGAYVGGEERVEIRGARMQSRSVYRYTLTGVAPGRYRLPPFRASLGGATARSRAWSVVVRNPANDPLVPTIVQRATLDARAGVNFRALVTPETVYVGQQATLQVGVFLDEEVRGRLRRNPEFVPPEPRAMLAYEVPTPPRVPPRRAGGKRYEAHVFQRALFPLGPGRALIPPARLVYSLPLTASFFSREETYTLRTDTLSVVAVEPPSAGRPAGYAGAVGELEVGTALGAGPARVGDPLVLTVRVSGVGNVKLFPRPPLAVPWATLVKGEERVRLDPPSALVRGTKEFDWILTPRSPGTHQLASIRYPFFNPYTERYEIAVTRPDTIQVAPGALAATDTLPADTVVLLALRPEFRGPLGDPVSSHSAFWLLAVVAPLPAAALGVRRRPRRHRKRSHADALRDAARAAGDAHARHVRRAYVAALSDRLALSPSVLTRRGALARALRRAGVTADAAAEAETLLDTLDAAAYAPDGAIPSGTAQRALAIYARVDSEARGRAVLGARLVPVLIFGASGLALLSTAGAAVLEARDAAAATFAHGVRAYGERRFGEAMERFADVARAHPTAADAWANFGTAGWAAGDTAAAAVGWQRALRLEPLAGDVRDRLQLLPTTATGLIAGVPPIPVTPTAVGALVAWLLAWALVARRLRTRGPASAKYAVAAFGAALVLGAGAWYAAYVRRADDRAVVAERGPLRVLPALAADPGPLVLPGDVAHTVARRGVWTHVRLAGGREGWIETDRLIPLGERLL